MAGDTSSQEHELREHIVNCADYFGVALFYTLHSAEVTDQFHSAGGNWKVFGNAIADLIEWMNKNG